MPAHDPEERRALASIAALTRSTRESGTDRMSAAHAAYRDSFRTRHECELCGLVEIDQSAGDEEIERRGKAAFTAHMKRLAYYRTRHQREAAEHLDAAVAAEAAAAEASAELADLASAS